MRQNQKDWMLFLPEASEHREIFHLNQGLILESLNSQSNLEKQQNWTCYVVRIGERSPKWCWLKDNDQEKPAKMEKKKIHGLE